MNRRTLAITAIVILAVFLLTTLVLPFLGVYADTQSDLRKKQQEKQQVQEEIKEVKEQKSDLAAQKIEMDKEIAALEEKIRGWDAQIAESDEQIAVKEEELAAATEKADQQYETFRTRIRVLYEEGSTSYLDILFTADDINDFFDRMEIMKQISAYDKEMLARYREVMAEIDAVKVSLEEIRAEQVSARDKVAAEKAVLDKKQAERNALMNNLNKTQAQLEAREKKIAQEEAALQEQIRAAARAASGGTYTGGALMKPSAGPITSQFGYRFHPVLKYNKLHSGTDFGASYGSNIYAAADGTVITSTYNNAYGNYIMINHGGGMVTLYAHGSQRIATVGQKVKRGDVIMKVGSTGYSTGPHLHFEVIVNGNYQNPMNYLN